MPEITDACALVMAAVEQETKSSLERRKKLQSIRVVAIKKVSSAAMARACAGRSMGGEKSTRHATTRPPIDLPHPFIRNADPLTNVAQ